MDKIVPERTRERDGHDGIALQSHRVSSLIASLDIIHLRSASIQTISGTNQSFRWTDWNQNGSKPQANLR